MIKTKAKKGGKRLLAIFMSVAIAITFMPGIGLLSTQESHAANVIKEGNLGVTFRIPDDIEGWNPEDIVDANGDPIEMEIKPVPWTLDEEGTLTIGDGSDDQIAYCCGYDYVDDSTTIPANVRSVVKKIVFNGNVNILNFEPFKSEGSNSLFSNMPMLEEFDATGLRLGDPVAYVTDGHIAIGGFCSDYMFSGNPALRTLDLRGTGLCENWVWGNELEGTFTFKGCENLETLLFDFDDEIAGINENYMTKYYHGFNIKHGFIIGGAFQNCPKLKSADATHLIAYVSNNNTHWHHELYGDWDGGFVYAAPTENSEVIVEGLYDDYPNFYRETMEEYVNAYKTALNSLATTDDPYSVVVNMNSAYAAYESAVENFITKAEYDELLAMKAEAEDILAQNPFPYSADVKTELGNVVSMTNALDETSTKQDAQNIINRYNQAMDQIAVEEAKNALDNSVKDAEDKLKDKDKYTDESAKALQDAVDKAKEVLNDDKSTQEDIEKAKEDIDKAIQGLVEKGNSGGNTPAVDPSKDPNKMGTDGTPVGPGASAAAADKAITSMKNDNDPPGSMFGLLQFKTTKQTKKSIKLGWKKPKGAVKFVVYGNLCGNKNKMKKLATVKGKSKNFKKVAGKKIKKGKYYKFIIVALDKKNMVVSTSKIVHVATKGGKVGNHKNVVVKAKVNAKGKKIKKAKKLSKTVIKTGKKVSLKTKATPANKKLKVKKHRKVAYESSNTKVATVTKKGVVKAKKKGTCYIYAYAQNGVFKKVKVTVK